MEKMSGKLACGKFLSRLNLIGKIFFPQNQKRHFKKCPLIVSDFRRKKRKNFLLVVVILQLTF